MITALDDLFRRYVLTLLTLYLVVAVAVGVGLAFLIQALVRAYLRYRGKRVVTCPETEQYAAVHVDAMHAAVTSLSGVPELRLTSCSRWPEREGCPQDCRWQIDLSPFGCRLRDLVTYWYMRRQCVYCGRAFGPIHWFEHQPALLSPDGRILELSSIRPEAVPDTLLTHKAVCWDCNMVEGFRAEHADLIVDRHR
jgi:hypothetical protein